MDFFFGAKNRSAGMVLSHHLHQGVLPRKQYGLIAHTWTWLALIPWVDSMWVGLLYQKCNVFFLVLYTDCVFSILIVYFR